MSKNFIGVNRRKYPRVEDGIVEYRTASKSNEYKRVAMNEAALTENVSAGGICFYSHERIPVNALLSIRFYLSHQNEPIETKGRVVWIRTSSFQINKNRQCYDIGIEFVDLEERTREAIYRYTKRSLLKHPLFDEFRNYSPLNQYNKL